MSHREFIIFALGCLVGLAITIAVTIKYIHGADDRVIEAYNKGYQAAQAEYKTGEELNTNYTLSPEPIRYEINSHG